MDVIEHYLCSLILMLLARFHVQNEENGVPSSGHANASTSLHVRDVKELQ
jgi:hypothetical protein